MPTYNVMINRNRTIEQSVEIEVKAKDEEAAQAKAEAMIEKAIGTTEPSTLDKDFEWETTSDEDSFEYEVSE